MYIDKWWGEYVGGTDDSMLLMDYFEQKAQKVFPLAQVFKDLHLDALEAGESVNGTQAFFDWNDGRADFMIVIDVVMDLSALVLESLHSGSVVLEEGSEEAFSISAEKHEIALLQDELTRFAADPLSYDLNEVVPDEDMFVIAAHCKEIAQELGKYI